MYNGKPILKKFYDALEDGKLLGMKCTECGNVEFYPVPTCNKCGCLDMEWVELSGDAIVKELVLVNPSPNLYGRDIYNGHGEFGNGVVQLKEGPEYYGMVVGITKENINDYIEKLPFAVKFEKFKIADVDSVAWRPVD